MINADMKYSDESRQISIGVIWKTTTSRMGMARLQALEYPRYSDERNPLQLVNNGCSLWYCQLSNVLLYGELK
jgi:hypothetical protein